MACRHLHVVNTYTVPETGTVLALNLSVPYALAQDKERFCLKVCASIPTTYDSYTATITIGTTAVALWNKYGNPLTIRELKKCKVMKGYYGATTPHVILSDIPSNYGCGCGM